MKKRATTLKQTINNWENSGKLNNWKEFCLKKKRFALHGFSFQWGSLVEFAFFHGKEKFLQFYKFWYWFSLGNCKCWNSSLSMWLAFLSHVSQFVNHCWIPSKKINVQLKMKWKFSLSKNRVTNELSEQKRWKKKKKKRKVGFQSFTRKLMMKNITNGETKIFWLNDVYYSL